jgi:hypothetical protein
MYMILYEYFRQIFSFSSGISNNCWHNILRKKKRLKVVFVVEILKYKCQFQYHKLAKIRFRRGRFNFSSGLLRFQLWNTVCVSLLIDILHSELPYTSVRTLGLFLMSVDRNEHLLLVFVIEKLYETSDSRSGRWYYIMCWDLFHFYGTQIDGYNFHRRFI